VTTVTTRRFPPEPFSPAWSWPCRRANILDAVGKAGAAFKSLGDAWADASLQNHGASFRRDSPAVMAITKRSN